MEHDTTMQSLWIEERLSRIELLSLQSFLANGHECHLYVYSDVSGVPSGVILKDAASIIPREFVVTTGGRSSRIGFGMSFCSLAAGTGLTWISCA
jgi:hypothetical protein